MTEWEPPRCEHGKILLGCDRDDCREQNAYVADVRARQAAWEDRQEMAVRELFRRELTFWETS